MRRPGRVTTSEQFPGRRDHNLRRSASTSAPIREKQGPCPPPRRDHRRNGEVLGEPRPARSLSEPRLRPPLSMRVGRQSFGIVPDLERLSLARTGADLAAVNLRRLGCRRSGAVTISDGCTRIGLLSGSARRPLCAGQRGSRRTHMRSALGSCSSHFFKTADQHVPQSVNTRSRSTWGPITSRTSRASSMRLR